MARSLAGGASTDIIEVATGGPLDAVAGCSISAWVFINAYDTLSRRWYQKDGPGTLGQGHSQSWFNNSGGQDRWEFAVSAWATQYGAWYVAGPTIGEWHHCLLTYAYSATTDDPIFYIDGVSQSVTETFTPSGARSISASTLGIGNSPVGFDRSFNGRQAEMVWWNTVLSADEAAALARGVQARRVRPSEIVVNFPLWGLHSPEINLSAGGLSGTVTGATQANHAPVSLFSRSLSMLGFTPPEILMPQIMM